MSTSTEHSPFSPIVGRATRRASGSEVALTAFERLGSGQIS